MTEPLLTGGQKGYLRIATEEAFATQEQMDAILRLVKEGRADKGTINLWGFYGTSASERTTFIRERLLDLGELRIQAMDEAGIDKAVLALTSPGVQSLFDLDEARGIASRANDHLKSACERYPDRFIGMAAVCPQDAEWSAQELKRAKEELGFVGVQINSHTHGHYLDEPQFDPILRACAELDMPLYIHPQGPARRHDRHHGRGPASKARCSASRWRRASTRCACSPRARLIAIPRSSSCLAMAVRGCRSGSTG